MFIQVSFSDYFSHTEEPRACCPRLLLCKFRLRPEPVLSLSQPLGSISQPCHRLLDEAQVRPCPQTSYPHLPSGAQILPDYSLHCCQHVAPLWDLLVILHWMEIGAIVFCFFTFLLQVSESMLFAFLISFVLPRPTSHHFYHCCSCHFSRVRLCATP